MQMLIKKTKQRNDDDEGVNQMIDGICMSKRHLKTPQE